MICHYYLKSVKQIKKYVLVYIIDNITLESTHMMCWQLLMLTLLIANNMTLEYVRLLIHATQTLKEILLDDRMI